MSSNYHFHFHINHYHTRYRGSGRNSERTVERLEIRPQSQLQHLIATPDWNKNWCPDCVLIFWELWSDEANAKWKAKGISPE